MGIFEIKFFPVISPSIYSAHFDASMEFTAHSDANMGFSANMPFISTAQCKKNLLSIDKINLIIRVEHNGKKTCFLRVKHGKTNVLNKCMDNIME